MIRRARFFYLSLKPMIDFFSYIPFISESEFLVMQSLRFVDVCHIMTDNTLTFCDVIKISDVNLNNGVPWHPIQPVYIKQVKIFDFYLPTGWIRVCEIRFANTGVICGNPYPVYKKLISSILLTYCSFMPQKHWHDTTSYIIQTSVRPSLALLPTEHPDSTSFRKSWVWGIKPTCNELSQPNT